MRERRPEADHRDDGAAEGPEVEGGVDVDGVVESADGIVLAGRRGDHGGRPRGAADCGGEVHGRDLEAVVEGDGRL